MLIATKSLTSKWSSGDEQNQHHDSLKGVESMAIMQPQGKARKEMWPIIQQVKENICIKEDY